MVRVADVDRNARADGGDNGLVGENAEARVGELAHFAVGHRGYTLRNLGHETRIDGINGVDVRKVLINVGAHGGGENRTGDIASAARKRRDLAVLRVAEESGINHDSVEIGERARQGRVASRIERRITEGTGENHARILGARVTRLTSARRKRDRDELGVIVFARGLHEIHKLGRLERGDLGETVHKIHLNRTDDLVAELKLLGHLGITLDDGAELTIGILALYRRFSERDEKIGNLGVLGVTLAGSGNHDDTPRGIRENDVHHLIELSGVRERTAAEFANFHL